MPLRPAFVVVSIQGVFGAVGTSMHLQLLAMYCTHGCARECVTR